MKRVLKIRLNVNLPMKDLHFYTFPTSVDVNFLSLLSTSMHIFSLRQASQIHVFVIFPFAEFFPRIYQIFIYQWNFFHLQLYSGLYITPGIKIEAKQAVFACNKLY